MTTTTAKIVHAGDATFQQEVLKASGPVLVDFWAEWCGPCRMLGPIIEKVAEKYVGRAKVVKVNTDEATAIAAKYGIMSIPTVMVFKNGEVVHQMVGLQPANNYAAILDRLL
ncbi:MAG: thioredoxin [Elusimicrobia bacterium RIFOXYB2_FULL_49_7]|nr:MAG: thioredoxin [Elusimicrobia bacterium RIFOXYB2_FULL_49_7]